MFYPDKLIVKASPKFNPIHGLEVPEESSLGATLPIDQHEISSGTRLPVGHTYADGQHGITKTHPLGITTEPMAYHLGKSLGVNIPTTVLRQFPSEEHGGALITHSVQKRVGGMPLKDLSDAQKTKAMAHPDFHKESIFKWLAGDEDGHDENHLYDDSGEKPTVHGIDNGEAFVYHGYHPKWKQNARGHITMPADNTWTDSNIRQASPYPVPEDFRQKVLEADPQEHRALMDKFLSHPNWARSVAGERRELKRNNLNPNAFYEQMPAPEIAEYIKNQYQKRLETLKAHMADPAVKTMGDLHSRLFHKPF
jgi:hypothetical protein